jgi:hypothetical protein
VVVRGVLDLLVRDRQLEAVAEDAQLRLVELLRLVGDVACLDPRAQGPALDRLGEDDRRGARVLGRRLVGRVHLAVVVAAAAELGEVSSSDRCSTSLRAAGPARRSARGCTPAGDRVLLELAVERLVHPLDEHAVDVAGEQVVPLATPDDLDDVPAGAPEQPSSSWMILPLPRTGPSRRCRLQLTTNVRLSRPSRAASERAPSDSGSSVSPSPRNAQTRCRTCP